MTTSVKKTGTILELIRDIEECGDNQVVVNVIGNSSVAFIVEKDMAIRNLKLNIYDTEKVCKWRIFENIPAGTYVSIDEINYK